ncbi:MAG TPA: lysine--tRNA ligase [Phycisphaerales bacterium]|nr:lysine--tRNA ligase [Phycisphaerales bacterium]
MTNRANVNPENTLPEEPHRLEAQRRENRAAVANLGLNPYGARTTGIVSVADARARYDEKADAEYQANSKAPPPGFVDGRPRVKVAGRVMLKRDGGKLIWLQVRDHTSGPKELIEGSAPSPSGRGQGKGFASSPPSSASPDSSGLARMLVPDLQIAVSAKDVAAPGFDVAKLLDLGDVIVAEGPLMRTKAGEITIWASSLTMASKSLMPPPAKHEGLHDVEIRYRRRYVDLNANPETLQAFKLRSLIASTVRRFLDGRGFVEVETPMLQTLAGGAAARPFVTHMNALDIDLFMRIAPELYLKRLLVGGIPRVYEINRNFRNEGLDKQHNPEFTMLEVYEAFGDCETVMEMTESLVRECARAVVGATAPGGGDVKLALAFNEHSIDYASPFARVTYAELFEKSLGFPVADHAKTKSEAKKRGLKHEGLAHVLIANELFETYAEKSLDPAKPTFITEYPAALSPLTRPKPGHPEVAERADLFIGGMEIAPHYTELNDPDVQEQKFREQLQGLDDEESTFRTFDQDFIDALKVGMPPAGGMGLGIDRLCMLLLNQRTIRDVVLFPMMRPQSTSPAPAVPPTGLA